MRITVHVTDLVARLAGKVSVGCSVARNANAVYEFSAVAAVMLGTPLQ